MVGLYLKLVKKGKNWHNSAIFLKGMAARMGASLV